LYIQVTRCDTRSRGEPASIAANSFGGNEASRFVEVSLLTHFLALPALATFQPTDYFLVHRHDAGQQVRVAREASPK
jgi:hypothetical protein